MQGLWWQWDLRIICEHRRQRSRCKKCHSQKEPPVWAEEEGVVYIAEDGMADWVKGSGLIYSGLREHGMEYRSRGSHQADDTESGVEYVEADFNDPDHPVNAQICEHGWHHTRCM